MKMASAGWRSLWVLAAGVAVFAASAPEAGTGALKDLGPGTYQATVKALVCDGCGAFIQKTMSRQPGIEAVAVDQKTKRVMFQVADKATVHTADLQKALDGAAGQMGMGADYTLQDLNKSEPKAADPGAAPARPRAERSRAPQATHEHQHH